MIIQSLNTCYEVIRQLNCTSRIAEYFCQDQQTQEAYLLVRIAEPTLAKRFALFLEEKIRIKEFTDYKECFQADGDFYVTFTYSLDRTLADKLATENCDRKERAEIARRLLEQLLLRNPHPYFMRNSLRPDMITASGSLDVAWNYHLDEVRTFDYCTMEAVCQRLLEVMQILFEEEMHGKQYPSLGNYLLTLEEGRMSDYLDLYREFMTVYEALCEEEQEHLPQTYLQRLWENCRKIGDKPNSLKSYLCLGKRYVAKKIVFVLVLIAIILPFLLVWLAYPWVQSRFLIKTMVVNSADTEGYTGKVRLVNDLEADNVIFVGTMTDGMINGQGALYDSEGNLRYQGEFLENQYSGMGKLYDEGGSLIYEGDFSRGLYEGTGTLYYTDGNIRYCGSFSRGLYDGVGALFYENGVASYEGEFLQGKKSGSGKAYDEGGELLYDGTFSQDRYEGEGILYRDGKTVCQGSFHTGVLTSGTAVYYDRQGNLLYQGGIDNGLYDGQGKLYSEGILIYEGGFAEGKYHGSGKEYVDGIGQLIYDGMFEQGKYSGTGRLYDTETGGLLYEGSFYQNLYDGAGKLYDPVEGYLVYEGGFREGQYDGHGKSYVSGILLYEGEYLLNTYNGKGILYDLTTGAVVFEGIFYNNEPRIVPDGPEQEDESSEMAAAVNTAE